MSVKKLLRNLFLTIIGFIALLIILAEVFKDQVVKTVLERGAQSFNVPLSVGEVDLTLLRKFPLATIEFNNIMVMDTLSEHENDTILSVEKLYASIDIQQLIDGNVYVKNIEVVGASANYLIDSTGTSNLDFIFEAMTYDSIQAEEPDTSKLQGIYELEDLSLENIKLRYADETLKLSSTIILPSVSVKGEVRPNGYMASIIGSTMLQQVSYENYRLSDLSSSYLEFNMSAINDTVTIDNIAVKAPHTNASIAGALINGKWPYLDLSYNGDISSLTHLLNLLPQKYIKEYKIHKLDGGVTLKGTVKGLLTDSLLPRIDATYQLDDLKVKYDTYPYINHMALLGTYSNGEEASNSTTKIYIGHFEAETMNSKFTASGDIKNLDNIFYNLKLGADVELADWISFVPDNLVQQMDGRIAGTVNTSGVLPDSITDDFTEYALARTSLSVSAKGVNLEMDSVPAIKGFSGKMKFTNGNVHLSNGKVKVPEYNFNLTDAEFSTRYNGSINDLDNMSFAIDTFMLELNNTNRLAGAAYLNSMNLGNYWLRAYSNLNLGDIASMVPDTLVTEMSGIVDASFTSRGKFDINSIEEDAMALFFENSRLNIETKNLTVITPDTLACIHNLSSQVSYQDDSLSINKTTGTYSNIDFDVDLASITKIYAGYFQNKEETILVKGNYKVSDLDYAFFLPFMEEDATENIETSASQESDLWTYKFVGNVSANSFKYGDALFEGMSAKVLVEPDYYVADSFFVSAFGGDMLASAKYKVGSDEYSVAQYKFDLKGMDIQQLFQDFNDFKDYLDEGEEPYLTSEQVTGIFSSHMDGRVIFGKDYEVNYDSMQVKGNLHLDEGSLINVQAIMDVEDIPMIGIKGLDNLQFSTLESKIFIFKNKWYVPSTEIVTTSFDANFFGMSSFKDDYSYHIRVFLGEVLASKSQKNLAKQAKEDGFDDGDVTKGRTALNLVSRMIDGKSKAWFDKKKDRELMKKTIRAQQGALNFIFFPKLVKFETGVE